MWLNYKSHRVWWYSFGVFAMSVSVVVVVAIHSFILLSCPLSTHFPLWNVPYANFCISKCSFLWSVIFFSLLSLCPLFQMNPQGSSHVREKKRQRNWEKESDEWVSAGSTSNSFACNMKLHSFRLHLIEWLLFSRVLREIESHRRRPKSCHVWLRQLESVFFGFSANDIKFVWTHPCRFYHPIRPDPNYFHSLSLSFDAKGDFRWVLLQSSYVIREALNLFDSVQ